MRKIIFVSAVSGCGKSVTCQYIKDNNLLEDYVIYDIDDLENINNYSSNTYNLFYENAIKNAIIKSNGRNIIIGSCINLSDLKKINMPKEVYLFENILITCSNDELRKRLKARVKSRNCSSDDYINNQIEYQKYLLKDLALYQLHIDNTNLSISDVANQIVNYIKK